MRLLSISFWGVLICLNQFVLVWQTISHISSNDNSSKNVVEMQIVIGKLLYGHIANFTFKIKSGGRHNLLVFGAVIFEGERVTKLADAVVVGALFGGGADAAQVAVVVAGAPALQGAMQIPLQIVKGDGLLYILRGCALSAVAKGRETDTEGNSTVGRLHIGGHVAESKCFKVDEQAGPGYRGPAAGAQLTEVLVYVTDAGYGILYMLLQCQENIGEGRVHW